ncbi:LysM peptidoglycan-binding domain-containing protein, partial [Paenibacillus validus]|uniref:LysM peptidoglycan-binding domain-containing protein n=2 Tax=Paenibacillus TaxID=44249 RepID=UPI002E1B4DD9|nr:LysM peptidoglycan-binding domain-containing protein [Paenibacillus validus]
MQIHVIQPGQSLYQLSQTYDVPVQTIAEANEIDTASTLVVGQALVIPMVGQYYWVHQGDSLFKIARTYGITPERLAAVNGISVNQPLTVGQRLYIPPAPRRQAEINAYIEPRGDSVSPALTQAARETAP